MDTAEQAAEKFLAQHGVPTHEPDGNIPPDFVLPGGIAIKVRRLNMVTPSNWQWDGLPGTPGDPSGGSASPRTSDLSTRAIPIRQAMEKICQEASDGSRADSYWISLRFDRSSSLDRAERQTLKNKLKAVSGLSKRTKVFDQAGICIHATPAKTKLAQQFCLTTIAGEQAGGWENDICRDVLLHAIKDKQSKVAPYHSKYREWWLVLVGCMAFLASENQSRPSLDNLSTTFDRVIVIDPTDRLPHWKLT